MMEQLFSLVFLFGLLTVGTRMTSLAFDKLVGDFSPRSRLTMGVILVALSTSLPELMMVFASGLAGRPEISLANLLGANVANLSLVIGGATVAAGTLPIVGNYYRFELAAMFMAGISPVLLLLDGGLSRFDGIILIVIYFIYLRGVIGIGKKERTGILLRFSQSPKRKKDGGILNLILGVGLSAFSATMIVRVIVQLSLELSISTIVLGTILASVGTTLPELTLGVGAALKKQVALIMGNLFGSVVANATLIVGLLALFFPFSIGDTSNYSLVNIAFVVVFGLFWLFTSTKRRLDRFEGLILIGTFVVFVGLELMLVV